MPSEDATYPLPLSACPNCPSNGLLSGLGVIHSCFFSLDLSPISPMVCRFYFLSKCSLHQLFLHPNCHCPIKATKNPLLLALPASASPCLSNLHASHQNCHSCQVTPLLKNFQSFPPARTCPHCLSICTHLAFHGLTDSGGSLPGLISHFTIIPRTLLGATHTAPPPVPQFSHLHLKYSSSSSLPV